MEREMSNEIEQLRNQQPGQVVAYRTLDRYGNPITDWIDGDPAGGKPIVPGGSFQMAYGAPQQGQSGTSPVDLAAEEILLRQEFESRWPVPKGVTWAAGVGDYCVSEFASGIALSYPDMWMAFKAGAARVNS